MSQDWTTKKLQAAYDYVSPAGASEIRLLPSFEEGEIVHATTPPEKTSIAAMLTGVGEFFYILKGEGELWRATGGVEHIAHLRPDRCVSIPPGTFYQYRAHDAPLEFLVTTVPRWQKESWAKAERCCWTDQGESVRTISQTPGPWITVDLPNEYQYLAPDNSEIRLLASVDAGGLAHCTLPPAMVSSAVRHRTVKEIWYVVDGTGEVWRSYGRDEELVQVQAGTCLTIPTGVSVQFRAFEQAPLKILIGTFPAWPGATEAETVPGHW